MDLFVWYCFNVKFVLCWFICLVDSLLIYVRSLLVSYYREKNYKGVTNQGVKSESI